MAPRALPSTHPSGHPRGLALANSGQQGEAGATQAAVILTRSWLKVKSEAMPWRIPPAEHGLGLAVLTHVPVRLIFAQAPCGSLDSAPGLLQVSSTLEWNLGRHWEGL